MVIKGSTRGHSSGDVSNLAKHLLNTSNNETVSVLETRGCSAAGFTAALHEMRAVALGGRTIRCLYSASINVPPDEQTKMSRRHWLMAVKELEAGLGMIGHQRAVVLHRKKGEDGQVREHVHIVWNRVHPVTLKAARNAWNYRIHEQVARKLERQFNLKPVIGVHTRPTGTPRPVAKATHKDQQAATRTGISVAEVADILKAAWQGTTSGKEFAQAIEAEGLTLARSRRGIVAVDGAGNPHSMPRRLGLPAATVWKRLENIDLKQLPSVDEAKSRAKSAPTHKEMIMKNTNGTKRPATARMGAVRGPAAYDWDELTGYWTGLGYEVDQFDNGLRIKLADGAHLYDQGDRMVLYRNGPPTDEDLRLMVTAAKARGWEGIYFSGGDDPEWQRRAKAEAIRQGYPPENISLECEKGKKPVPPPPPPPVYQEEKMPVHLLKKLGKAPVEPDQPPEPEVKSDFSYRM